MSLKLKFALSVAGLFSFVIYMIGICVLIIWFNLTAEEQAFLQQILAERIVDLLVSAAGEAIADPLEHTEVFPPMVTQMIRVGEETGNLDEMLEKIADFYDDEVENAVESLVKAIEPAMMVVLGVIVGGIVIAMYLPIFSLITTVGAG